MNLRNWYVAPVLAFSLAACLPQTPAPVSERSLVSDQGADVYVVQKYDTLYSVAWRYDLDVEALAERNALEPPYVIRPGQRIALTVRGAASSPPLATTARRPTSVSASPGEASRPSTAGTVSVPNATVPGAPGGVSAVSKVASPSAAGAPSPRAGAPSASDTAAPAAKSPPSPAPAQPAAPDVPATLGTGAWRRPVAAKPVRGFGGASKGLDYALSAGTSIRASTTGAVVYAGPGLGGFRHLVIVKASDRHLVAYGVNVAPTLKEGDQVNAGDTVAQAGASAAAGQFHFEIRDRGKPVDPRSLIGG